MTLWLRMLLFLSAVATFTFVTRKIRKSHVRIMDMFFWVSVSMLLILMAVYPEIVKDISHIFGFESPANLVFLLVIFLLGFKCFTMSIEMSRLKEQVSCFVEELAVRQTEKDEAIDEDFVS